MLLASSRMITHLVSLLALVMFFNACSRAGGDSSGSTVPLLSDVLTPMASIEDDPTLDFFQIVDPAAIGVDSRENIYVADEHTLKIYKPDGSPSRLIGREGSGPGEFIAPFSVNIGPTGNIAAMDVLWDVNIYASDGEFLDRINYRSDDPYRDYLRDQGFTFTMMNEVIAIDPDHLLIDLFALDNTQPGPYIGTSLILYSTPDSLYELCRYVSHESVKIDENSTNSAEFQGKLIWSMIDSEHLLYTETFTDRLEDGGRSSYQLIILDLATLLTDTLTVPWSPELIPPEVKVMKPFYSEFLDTNFEVEPVIRDILEDTRYYPPLKDLRVDQGIVFGFHYSPTDSVERDFEDEDLEVEPHLVDIIDLATGRLLARAEFPFLPEVIKGGRAYRLYTPLDDFPAVYVYQIDPRLYALREELN